MSKSQICTDGSAFDGVLRKTLEAHCRKCGQASLGLSGNHDMAKAELRADGWETRGGLWICVHCTFTTPRGTRFVERGE